MTSPFRNGSVLSAEFYDGNAQTTPTTIVDNARATPADLVAKNIFHKMIFPANWQFIVLSPGQKTLHEYAEHWRTVMAAGYARVCTAISRCALTDPRRATLECYVNRWQDAIKKIIHDIFPVAIMKNLLHDLHTLQLAQMVN
jgi:hypothetical protein